jgi:hypothetical protein
MGKVCHFERAARNLRSLTFVRDDSTEEEVYNARTGESSVAVRGWEHQRLNGDWDHFGDA